MAVYAIGDVQGCHFSFLDLLQKIKYKPDRDELIFVGDLVNRGQNSLLFSQWCLANQSNIQTVLGNHDLHLIAIYFDQKKHQKNDTLENLLYSNQIDLFIEWLIKKPLAILRDNYLVVHAGIHPTWSINKSLKLADKVHLALNNDPANFLGKMYGNQPGYWSDDLKKSLRRRMTINIMTRMRALNFDLSLNYDFKGKIPKKIDREPYRPWFDFERIDDSRKIITGHWSAIGVHRHSYGISIDSGCVWGQKLTAFCLESQKTFKVPANPKDLIN
jgi:bis(5'-nucleosyl)-tetraphosphatase (symmetrical)